MDYIFEDINITAENQLAQDEEDYELVLKTELDTFNEQIDMIWNNVILRYVENGILNKLDMYDKHKFKMYMLTNCIIYKDTIIEYRDILDKQIQ